MCAPRSLLQRAPQQALAPGTRFAGAVDSTFENGFYLTLELCNGQRVQGVMYRRSSQQQHPAKMESAVGTGLEHMCADSAAVEYNSSMPKCQQQQHAAAREGPAKRQKLAGEAAPAPQQVPPQPRSALFFFASSITPEQVCRCFPHGRSDVLHASRMDLLHAVHCSKPEPTPLP